MTQSTPGMSSPLAATSVAISTAPPSASAKLRSARSLAACFIRPWRCTNAMCSALLRLWQLFTSTGSTAAARSTQAHVMKYTMLLRPRQRRERNTDTCERIASDSHSV